MKKIASFRNLVCETCREGSHSSYVEDPSVVGCDTVLLGD
jgi:hypothetical protein